MAKKLGKTTAPFKKFRCEDKKVFLLPSAAFKVWMYHFTKEGPNKISWPKLETICKELDMDEKTVKRQRRALLLNGWLKRVGEKQNKVSGKFNVPIMQVDEGVIPEGNFYPAVEPKAPRVKTTPRTQGKNTPAERGAFLPTEVDSEKQVDSKKQVDTLATPACKEKTVSTEAGRLGQIPEPQGKNAPMVEPKAFAQVQMESFQADSFPGLEWERGYGWCAHKGIGRALTAEEIMEMKRRNDLRLMPAEVSA